MVQDPVVSATWLAAEFDEPDLRIVDATWFMPGDARVGREAYRQGHIPGAVFFDIDAISDPDTDLPHMLPNPQALAEALGDLGLTRDDRVVVYDGQGIFSAPRVWWTLRIAGFERVYVLDGGLKAWVAQGGATEAGEPAVSPARVEPSFDSDLVRNLDEVRAIVAGSGHEQLVDARAVPRFRGEAPEPREGLRSGHMPGACNVPWQTLLTQDGRMRDKDALRAAFEAAGVDFKRPIVTTCGSGVSAALLALALARVGMDRVPVYDGSWTEWGGLADTPVATGG